MRRSLGALLVAEVVSHAGMAMTWVALPWFVLTTTGSATKMGIVLAAELLPVAFLGIPSGRVVDRIGARRAMIVCDAVRGVLMASIGMLSLAGWLSFPLLVALVAVLGSFIAPYHAAQRVVLPEVLGEDEKVLTSANALLQGATRLAGFVGPALGGLLVAAVSPQAALLVDAATYVVAVVLITSFVPRRAAVAHEGEPSRLLDGVRFLFRDKLLATVTVSHSVTEMAFQGLFAAIPFAVATRYAGDARLVGWFLSAFSGGAVAGTIVAVRLLKRIPGFVAGAAAALTRAVVIWALAFDPPVAVVLVVMALIGIVNPFSNAPMTTALTLRTPVAMRGQVVAAAMTLIMLAGPLGIIGAAPALEAYGVQPVFIAIAAASSIGDVLAARAFLRGRRIEVSAPPRTADAAASA